jgi:hypothetical protein
MPKKSARKPDPQALAKKLVDVKLSEVENSEFWIYGGDGGEETGPLWEALVTEIEAIEQQANPTYRNKLAEEDVAANLQPVHARAGFLVGLELGRRLGGAR